MSLLPWREIFPSLFICLFILRLRGSYLTIFEQGYILTFVLITCCTVDKEKTKCRNVQFFNTFNIFKLKISEKTWQWEGVMHHAIAACCLYFDIFTQNVPVVWSITLNLQGSICILLLLISYIIFCVENAYFAYACQDTPTHWRKFVRPKVVFLPKYKLKGGVGTRPFKISLSPCDELSQKKC